MFGSVPLWCAMLAFGSVVGVYLLARWMQRHETEQDDARPPNNYSDDIRL